MDVGDAPPGIGAISGYAIGSNQSFRVDAMNGDLGRMRVAREHGATDVNGALYCAAQYGQIEAMRLLHDEWGATMAACIEGSRITRDEEARRLLEQWAHPNVKFALKR